MPMKWELYPKDWKKIARAVKDAANWTCQECGRPCRKPKVDWYDFEMWLYENFCNGDDWWDDVFEMQPDGSEKRKPQRFTLTVAHLDRVPANCELSNLKALCSVCHMRYDAVPHGQNAAIARKRNRYLRREANGQATLAIGEVNS